MIHLWKSEVHKIFPTASTKKEPKFIIFYLQVQHTMQFPGEYRVEWMSPEETYMHLGEHNLQPSLVRMPLFFQICDEAKKDKLLS